MFRLIRNLFHKTREVGSYVGTFRTHDAAFAFRMNTGFPGTVNRTHPASIEPCLIDPNATIAAYGMGVIVDSATQGVRTLVAGDGAVTNLYGIAARPYPVQAASASSYGATTFGSGAPPPSQPLDVLKGGYILVALNNFAVNNSVKNGPVYVNISTSTTTTCRVASRPQRTRAAPPSRSPTRIHKTTSTVLPVPMVSLNSRSTCRRGSLSC